jgi:hypothetical protein
MATSKQSPFTEEAQDSIREIVRETIREMLPQVHESISDAVTVSVLQAVGGLKTGVLPSNECSRHPPGLDSETRSGINLRTHPVQPVINLANILKNFLQYGNLGHCEIVLFLILPDDAVEFGFCVGGHLRSFGVMIRGRPPSFPFLRAAIVFFLLRLRPPFLPACFTFILILLKPNRLGFYLLVLIAVRLFISVV